MKKHLYFFIFILFSTFLISGCANKKNESKNVKTIIEQKEDVVIAVNYPQFGYQNFDEELKKYIDDTYINFQKEFSNKGSANGKSELNIDYSYQYLNEKYYNVVITSFVNSSSLAHPITEIKTFHYNTKTKKSFTLENVISKEELKKLTPLFKQELIKNYKECLFTEKLNSIIDDNFEHYENFSFNDDDLIVYFNPYTITNGSCGIAKASISLDKINLLLDIERGAFQEKNYPSMEIKKRLLDPNKKTVAFTFDDGPSTYTKQIFQILKKHQANATFFVIGNKVELYQNLLRKIVKDGNELGNHSYNHKWLTRVTDEELLRQIEDTQNIITKATGATPKLFRPTYGSINKHLRDKVNLEIVMWTVDTSDWKTTNSKKIAEQALKQIQDGDIILMHDNHKQTIQALDFLLEALEKDDYQFVTVSELNEIQFIRNLHKSNG